MATIPSYQQFFSNNLSNEKRARKFLVFLAVTLSVFALVLYSGIISRKDSVENMSSNKKCIFCDIANGRVPETKLEVETDEFVIFKDIKPASDHHYLAVPKVHYDSLKVLNKSHEGMVQRMSEALRDFYESKDINTTDALFGFHLPPFITVNHLHMHAIAPRSKIGLIYRQVFKPGSFWFVTVEQSREYLRKKEL